MSFRKLDAEGEPWEYSIGRTGISIIDPRNQKRYNVDLVEFGYVLDKQFYTDSDEVQPIAPGDVRKFVDIAYRGTIKAPDFVQVGGTYSYFVNVWSSLTREEVTRRVKERFPEYELREEDIGCKTTPSKVLPESHKVYRFRKAKL